MFWCCSIYILLKTAMGTYFYVTNIGIIGAKRYAQSFYEMFEFAEEIKIHFFISALILSGKLAITIARQRI